MPAFGRHPNPLAFPEDDASGSIGTIGYAQGGARQRMQQEDAGDGHTLPRGGQAAFRLHPGLPRHEPNEPWPVY